MNFEDLLSSYGVPYQTEGKHCRDGWLQLDCPFCAPMGPLYLGYNKQGGYFNCWRCGPLSVIGTLTALTKERHSELKRLIGGLERVRSPKIKITGTLKLPKGRKPLRSVHKQYLRSRRYNPEEIVRLWRIEGIGLASKLSWRLFIPIIYHGDVVSWTTRACRDDVDARYISASLTDEALPHKQLLYGEDYVRHTIIVHEGPLDVWRTGPGAVCTCGTGYSQAQVRRIARYARRVICFDNEPKAQQRAKLLCDMLDPFPGETFNVTLEGKDASASTDLEIDRLRATFLDFQ